MVRARPIALFGCILGFAATAAASSDPLEIARGRQAAAGPQLAYIDGPTWYAIAGSFDSRGSAERSARELGGNWHVVRSNICVNYTPGLWIVAAGFFSHTEALRYARPVGGYAKACL